MSASSAPSPPAATWSDKVPFTRRVVSSPTPGGGFPSRRGHYEPGTCQPGMYDANFSESTLAARPGDERLVGASKFFFGRFSTFYNFTTGTFDLSGDHRSHIVNGYDCITTHTQTSPPTWTSTTDPTLAFDRRGRLYDVVLAFNWYRLDGNVYLSHSDDSGHHWVKGNGGRPLEAGPVDDIRGTFLDKPWVAVNTVPGSRDAGHVYAVWAVRRNASSAIHLSVSRDRGATFSPPLTLPTPQSLGATNPWPYITVDAHGDVYVVYLTYRADGTARFWTARSTDDGRSCGHFAPAGPPTTVDLADAYPGTRVHVGAPESFAASPTQRGHLYLTWEELRAGQLDVRLISSSDGGRHWTAPRLVNDDRSGTDQLQPIVAAGSAGAVAVAFYDKRAGCPRNSTVAPSNRGRRNTCISLTLQPMRDRNGVVDDVGGNRRISAQPWDPEQPTQRRGGLGQLACDAFDDPCTDIFIGDYFGLVVTPSRIAAMSVSTAEPSPTLSDSGQPIHYQQQVLATVARRDLGL
ncbi:MAG: sialidase family protein [Pseudonocardiales bacterium]